MNETILVLGATGRQGGAVVSALQKAQFSIRAFVRDLKSDRSIHLSGAGIELAKGNLDDTDSLKNAMKGVYGVYSVQSYSTGVRKEIEQGKRVADIAKESGVKHIVYSSAGGAEKKTGISFFDSKWVVEEHIRSLKLPYTIFRPASFMENFSKLPRIMVLTTFRSFVKGNSFQMIAVADIGKWVALAFSRPAEFLNKEIEIAGDELNYQQARGVYGRVYGRKGFGLAIPLVVPGEAGKMFRWLREHGHEADLQHCRRIIKDSLTFEEWVVSQRKPT